jgi:hypothetical protein
MRTSLTILGATVGLASLFAFPAHAGSITKTLTQNPATACTLSVPTTDTKVRPKALGFRNEGTTNAFVICGYDIDSTDPGFDSIEVNFVSIDGAAHQFNCTGASRFNFETSAQYLTKAVSVPASGGGGFSISTSDGDYDENVYDLYPWGQSVTCILPPGVAIISVLNSHTDEDSIL